MKLFIPFFLVTFLFTSCLKDEIPVPPHESGDIIENAVELGNDYRYQAYYDFETNTFVKQHVKTDWDLGFETSANGFRIVLNGAKSTRAAQLTTTNFASVSDTIGAIWKYDAHSGTLDSTAIGNWQGANSIYIIDRGYSYNGTHLGFRKIEFTSVTANVYTIHYAHIDGSNEITRTIAKNPSYNFTFFSFETNSEVSIEPEKEKWDLVFGQYTFLFEPDLPYLVTGVLANRNGVEIAEVFDIPFSEITFSEVANRTFSTDIDIIGYDWKTFSGGTYVIHSEKSYLVKTVEGYYYKIHFIDFYNDAGEKGAPRFEIGAL